jgi:hypothetical protein
MAEKENSMTPDPAGLLKLAERCEQATGPSYALEVEIWDAIYPGEREGRWQEWLRVSPSSMTHNLGPSDRDGYIKPRRAFTASPDAAMTLVPEGWSWTVDAVGRASCFAPNEPHPWPRAGGLSKTPALALCAAALRAKAHHSGGV